MPVKSSLPIILLDDNNGKWVSSQFAAWFSCDNKNNSGLIFHFWKRIPCKMFTVFSTLHTREGTLFVLRFETPLERCSHLKYDLYLDIKHMSVGYTFIDITYSHCHVLLFDAISRPRDAATAGRCSKSWCPWQGGATRMGYCENTYKHQSFLRHCDWWRRNWPRRDDFSDGKT